MRNRKIALGSIESQSSCSLCIFCSSFIRFPLLLFAAVNGAVTIKDPFSGLERGSLSVLLAVGGEEQIARLHKMENAAALIQVSPCKTLDHIGFYASFLALRLASARPAEVLF